MNKFEQGKLYAYVVNMLSSKAVNFDKASKFIRWHMEEGYSFFPFKWNLEEIGLEEINYDTERNLTSKSRNYLKKQLVSFREELNGKAGSLAKSVKSNEEKFLLNLQELFALSTEEKEILGLLLRYKFNNEFEELIDKISNELCIKRKNLALMTGYSEHVIDKVLSYNASLSRYGLLDMDFDGSLTLSKLLKNLYSWNISTAEQLEQFILGKELKATLIWEDFEYIENKDFCLQILKNALQSKETGINILLYGEPGTGKTEFAKTLCDNIHVALYAVGEGGSEDNNKDDYLDIDTKFRSGKDDYRKQYLDITQKILKNNQNTCLLIDEADDVFDYKKIVVNRMLETNLIPRIWIINSIEDLDKAYLRRFSFALQFEKPNLTARTKIWQKRFQEHGFVVNEATAKDFAVSYCLPPSFVSSAVRSSSLAHGGLDEVRNCLNALEQAYNNGRKKQELPQRQDFNPALINTDMDLSKLANQLVTLEKRNFSLCLYGASGTGKSAYAEYLAEKLGLNIVKKQCSSLLGMFVGQTEQNIARAFQEARDNEAMLVFDEADSFLQDRNGAVRSWEITQVNEMLTQMENFAYPFVCTTNLMDRLDKASLRRFIFKVKYDFMKDEQVREAFKFFFGKTIRNCRQFNKVTAGDFVVVKNKAEILGCLDNVRELKAMLLEEQNTKDLEKSAKKLGFL